MQGDAACDWPAGLASPVSPRAGHAVASVAWCWSSRRLVEAESTLLEAVDMAEAAARGQEEARRELVDALGKLGEGSIDQLQLADRREAWEGREEARGRRAKWEKQGGRNG